MPAIFMSSGASLSSLRPRLLRAWSASLALAAESTSGFCKRARQGRGAFRARNERREQRSRFLSRFDDREPLQRVLRDLVRFQTEERIERLWHFFVVGEFSIRSAKAWRLSTLQRAEWPAHEAPGFCPQTAVRAIFRGFAASQSSKQPKRRRFGLRAQK
jgi:hypothetical protein